MSAPPVPAARAPRVARAVTLDLGAQTGDAMAALCRQLYPVHRDVFSGSSEEDFRKTVLQPPAERSMLQYYLDPAGKILGYCAMHRFRRWIAGRSMIVMRAEAGLRPEYRLGGVTNWFVARRLLVVRLRHPFARIYMINALVHPSGYHKLCTFFPVVFPRVDRPPDPALAALAADLAESFPDPAVSADDPLIRSSRWIAAETRVGGAELRAPRSSPHARFYVARNPGFRRGDGLVVLIPVTFANLGRAILALTLRRLRVALGLRR